MEQVTISINLAFASELTYEQLTQLQQQARELVEQEVLEGGALAPDENEVVEFGVAINADDE